MKSSKRVVEILILTLVFATSLFLIWDFFQKQYTYQRFENDTVRYQKGVVTEVVDQKLQLSEDGGVTGYQNIEVKLRDGETVLIENYITLTHNVVVQKDVEIIVCVDEPEGVEPYYSVYSYNREKRIGIVLLSFVLLMILIGRTKGIRSALGLGCTVCVMVCYMIPRLYEGEKAWKVILISLTLSALGSCFCIGGFEKKTLCNIINTMFGGISAGLIFLILMKILKLNRGMIELAEELQMISRSTGMNLHSIMFAGVMISALGAVMDVAVTLSSALWEIKKIKKSIIRREMFFAGMDIGKDMIGTMTNTLILAFLGGALPTLIVFVSYGVQYHQFISSDFLVMEMVCGIAGSMAVILSVPISAFVCSVFYCSRKECFQ